VGASEEDVWASGGSYSYAGWLTVADEIRIQAGGDAADTAAGAGAQQITCSGLDANWAPQTATIETNGASASTKTTETWIRVNRCLVSRTGAYHASLPTADVTIETEAGTIVALIAATIGQTTLAMYTCPADTTCYVRNTHVCAEGAKGADVYFWHLENADDTSAPYSGAKRLVEQFPGLSGCTSFQHTYWDPFPEKTDLWWSAQTVSGANTDVTIEWEMTLEASD